MGDYRLIDCDICLNFKAILYLNEVGLDQGPMC